MSENYFTTYNGIGLVLFAEEFSEFFETYRKERCKIMSEKEYDAFSGLRTGCGFDDYMFRSMNSRHAFKICYMECSEFPNISLLPVDHDCLPKTWHNTDCFIIWSQHQTDSPHMIRNADELVKEFTDYLSDYMPEHHNKDKPLLPVLNYRSHIGYISYVHTCRPEQGQEQTDDNEDQKTDEEKSAIRNIAAQMIRHMFS